MQLVNLADIVPNAIINLPYATQDNVAGKVLYNDNVAQLDADAAKQLVVAAKHFSDYALRLVIWDAYRPAEVQQELLKLHTDPTKYVLPVEESKHPKGLAIDLTLAYKDGELLDMGSDFDDFTPKAHVDADNLSYEQLTNRAFLADGMAKFGFTQWPYEWWHFDYQF